MPTKNLGPLLYNMQSWIVVCRIIGLVYTEGGVMRAKDAVLVL